MSKVQESENTLPDPRWMAIRPSRINLAVTLCGAVFSFPLLWWVPLPFWVRVSLSLLLVAAMAWDIYDLQLMGRHSVNAFYLYDLDPIVQLAPADGGAVGSPLSRFGIRLTLAHPPPHAANEGADAATDRELDGTVEKGAFVSPWFTSLRYRMSHDPAWRRWWPHVITLWPDSIDKEAFRRTRIALKWK